MNENNLPTILVTGAAGFIGFHLSRELLEKGYRVIGLDCMNEYYDVSLKKSRLEILKPHPDFVFCKEDIQNLPGLKKVFQTHAIDRVCNLAAQAGVRYSLENPFSYQKSNLEGFLNLLEMAREYQVQNFVYASSSSVYGSNEKTPFSVEDRVDTPVSLYAATKKANELMAHAYHHLFDFPCTGLRFFTVYGPWGRPDMALFLFTKAILEDKPINVFNDGKMQRDFTYIDDIIEGVVRVMGRLPEANPIWNGDAPDPGTSSAPYKVYNIGNNNPVELIKFIEVIEKRQGLKVACLEEIAFRMGYIDANQVEKLAQPLVQNSYGQYLLDMVQFEG